MQSDVLGQLSGQSCAVLHEFNAPATTSQDRDSGIRRGTYNPFNGYLMTTADRPSLVRCTLFLSSLAWILPACVLGLSLFLIQGLAGISPISSNTGNGTSATLEIGLSSFFQGNTLMAFSMALAVFAVVAIGSILAIISVMTGRQALKLGSRSASVILAMTFSGLYLAILAGTMLGAVVT